MQDQGSLVRRVKQGDQAAFAELYEEYFDRIYRYVAIRIGDRTEAEDMAQQVFLNALKAIPSFDWKGVPLAAWLFRIAHNQVVDHLRKKSKSAPSVDVEEDMLNISSGTDCNPETLVETKINMEKVMQATSKLTDAQREVISLRFASELPIDEVAKIMGKSQGAVKALQHSAIGALRRVLLVEDNEQIERI